MVTVKITQILSSALSGKINYYYQIEGDDTIRDFGKAGYFTIDFDYWGKIAEKLNNPNDEAVDAEVIQKVFKKTYGYFKIIMNGKDVTPERKPHNVEIREELEDGDYSLDELFEMYEAEDNIFKKSTGLIRITAKYKKMIINDIIFKMFEDMEADYKKYI